jgi:diguanylate cyclase (GGDEF)-like protein
MADDAGHSAYADLGVRRRIGKKLAMWVGVAALVLGALVAAVLIPIERQATEQTSLDQIGLLAEAVAATYAVIDERHRTHRAEAVIAQVGRAPEVLYVDVTNHAGKVTRSSRPLNVGQQRALSGESLREVSIAAEELKVSLQMPWQQDCVGCHDASHNPVGAITVAVDRKAALSSLERFHALLLIALVVVFVLVVVLLLVITDRLVSRPVFGLARLMAKAESGDFLVRARYASDDELGALSRAFNSMLKNITELKASELQREADLEEAQRELELKHQLEEANDALEGANAMLERRVRAQQLLMEAAHRFSSTLDRDQLLDRLQQVIVDKVHMSDFALFLIDEGDDGEAILRVERAHGRPDREEVHQAVFHVGEGITGFVAETGAPLLIDDVAKERDRAGPETRALTEREVTNPGASKPFEPSGTLAAVPLIHKGRVVGVLTLFHTEIEAFDTDDMELFQALGALAATAVVNADLYNKTLELSVTDALTGLMNRRAMERRLEMELIRAQRFNMPLCVLMVDVDHFKNYNDRMGHLLGDEALKAVASALDGSVRKVDAVARFGGEEFCVFLPRTDEASGLDVADKLHGAVRSAGVEGAATQPLGHLSISVGLAVYPQDMPPAFEGTPHNALLDRADQAVYAAKHAGRDRTVAISSLIGTADKPGLHEPSAPEAGDAEQAAE